MPGTFDTLSEISDGTAGTSSVSGTVSCFGDSREDLRDMAEKLGPDLYNDRFRVDRRKLEQMLIAGAQESETAEEFFKKIQGATGTLIIWPSRLKIGAKSKKDPNIRIAGRQADVKAAKEMVITVLDARSNRVTMKLDVSYTDHSHIIGRKGETIQRVMKLTGCHIHFPDSNRNNPTEKSNQVSIAGDMGGVEAARASVRNLTPLIFSFELPIVGSLQTMPDSNTPELQSIQTKYNVQISFRTRPKLHATLVVIKGTESELSRVKDATLVVINFMCESLANQVLVQMTLEISPQHHPIVLGVNSINLKMIKHHTGCQIMFPDAEDPNIPALKKSNINITGRIHQVYQARQMLLGSLPLVLMFDLPEDNLVDNEYLTRLMNMLSVNINIRHKPKQNALSVVVRGVERNASNLYEARHKLLRLEGYPVHASIPDTYHIPTSDYTRLTVNTSYGFYPPSPMMTSPMMNSPMMNSPMMNSPMMNSPMMNSPVMNAPVNFPAQPMWGALPPIHPPHYSHLFPPQLMMHQFGHGYVPISCKTSSSSGVDSRPNSALLSDIASYRDYSVYSPMSSNNSSLSSPSASPRNVSPDEAEHSTHQSVDLNSMMSDYLQVTDSEVKPSDPSGLPQQSYNYFGYEDRKLEAAKAKQEKPKAGYLREPTSKWAGYGFSDSSPALVTQSDKSNTALEDDVDPWISQLPTPFFTVSDYDEGSNGSQLASSNILDSASAMSLESIANTKAKDLATLLYSINLEKYIATLVAHEIDLATFVTLTENDLKEVGIRAFGARRKMLLAIAEYKSRHSPFSSRRAPGAERKNLAGVSNNGLAENNWQ